MHFKMSARAKTVLSCQGSVVGVWYFGWSFFNEAGGALVQRCKGAGLLWSGTFCRP